jgi:hypothetical protein
MPSWGLSRALERNGLDRANSLAKRAASEMVMPSRMADPKWPWDASGSAGADATVAKRLVASRRTLAHGTPMGVRPSIRPDPGSPPCDVDRRQGTHREDDVSGRSRSVRDVPYTARFTEIRGDVGSRVDTKTVTERRGGWRPRGHPFARSPTGVSSRPANVFPDRANR